MILLLSSCGTTNNNDTVQLWWYNYDSGEGYFSNWKLSNKISTQVDTLLEKLITENLDYNNKEVDDMVNKEIDDFIINFNIHYK